MFNKKTKIILIIAIILVTGLLTWQYFNKENNITNTTNAEVIDYKNLISYIPKQNKIIDEVKFKKNSNIFDLKKKIVKQINNQHTVYSLEGKTGQMEYDIIFFVILFDHQNKQNKILHNTETLNINSIDIKNQKYVFVKQSFAGSFSKEEMTTLININDNKKKTFTNHSKGGVDTMNVNGEYFTMDHDSEKADYKLYYYKTAANYDKKTYLGNFKNEWVKYSANTIFFGKEDMIKSLDGDGIIYLQIGDNQYSFDGKSVKKY